MKKLLLVLCLLFLANPANAALSLDGSNSSATGASTLTTSLTNDVIVVIVKWTTIQGSSITDTAGLTWTRRYSGTQVGGSCAGGSFVAQDVWWAISPGALIADVITAVGYDSGADRVTSFGVNGANTTTPFDPNVSIPATSSLTCPGVGKTLTVNISTNNPNTFLIDNIVLANATLATPVRPSGFTQILATGSAQDLSYNIVSSTQSSAAVTWSNANNLAWTMYVDAIQAPSAATPKNLFFQGFP